MLTTAGEARLTALAHDEAETDGSRESRAGEKCRKTNAASRPAATGHPSRCQRISEVSRAIEFILRAAVCGRRVIERWVDDGSRFEA